MNLYTVDKILNFLSFPFGCIFKNMGWTRVRENLPTVYTVQYIVAALDILGM